MATAVERLEAALFESMRPPVRLWVDEWADRFRYLTDVSSPEPGRWRTDRAPYLREVMRVLSREHPARRVFLMKGTQIGATECGNNWLGYIMHHNPGPMLYVEPTVDMVKDVRTQRIDPMIESTPVLRERVAPARSRDSGNTQRRLRFSGGILRMVGANSAVGFRSMPASNAFCDEMDGYPGDVDGEGDPLALIERRMSNYPRSKLFGTSTPTLTGLSRIEREFLQSDQRRFFIPCPRCGHFDWLQWRIGGWRGNEGRHHHIHFEGRDPSTARMRCAACDALVPETAKPDMLAAGEWRPTAEARDRHTVGFHLSALYSPLGWRSWEDVLAEFLRVKDEPVGLKTWVNTALGETFEERGERVDPANLRRRADATTYAAEVPTGVGLLVCAVDVQGNRLECAVWGFGAGEECWLIAFHQIDGDPARDTTWFELGEWLRETYTHEGRRQFAIDVTCIDSGGAHTEEVYRFCRTQLGAGRRVFPIKGSSETGHPLVPKAPSSTNRYRVPLWLLCTDTGKDTLMSRLRIESPGHGHYHLPAWTDDEFIAQLTAERAVRKYVKGRGAVREWIKTRERNEAMDLAVYGLAGMGIAFPIAATRSAQLEARAATWATPLVAPDEPAGPAVPTPAPVPENPTPAAAAAPPRKPGAARPGAAGPWALRF